MLKSAWQHAWLITQNITPSSLWQQCIHLHGNTVTVRAGGGNGGKVGYKMDWFVVNFDLFASAFVWGGQQQCQAAWWRKEEGSRGAWDKHAGMRYQPRECPLKWSGWWWNKCTPPQQLHLQKGCQRIHREAGEVCNISITDFWEEGIKLLVPNKRLVC